jgi:energy-converting hydrogenase Eha subunit A
VDAIGKFVSARRLLVGLGLIIAAMSLALVLIALPNVLYPVTAGISVVQRNLPRRRSWTRKTAGYSGAALACG